MPCMQTAQPHTTPLYVSPFCPPPPCCRVLSVPAQGILVGNGCTDEKFDGNARVRDKGARCAVSVASAPLRRVSEHAGWQPPLPFSRALVSHPLCTHKQTNPIHQVPFAHGHSLISTALFRRAHEACQGEYYAAEHGSK